ncbi:type I phosphatidylinositol 4,5-bisphosphate 4-phosphatase-A-like [Liolophura sinensis]|uniref:type I phosphatidylinositol 4,5-bisphosphate 4-phosphatase-A-like n=1 Tax=Liolophura sinensis TaxID=3198878 RepID=UPI003159027D
MEYKRLEEETPTEAPPPYSPPTSGLQASGNGYTNFNPSVSCECCGFAISLTGVSPTTRLVQCQQCRQHTPVGPPPPGKKYVRCSCKKLLHCSITATKVRCPGCKIVLNTGQVAGPMGGAVAVPITTTSVAMSPNCATRITCGHCSQVMMFAPRGIARCPHCRGVSSVGKDSARIRAIIYFILAFIFLGGGIGVTVGTYAAASIHGGYYYVWTGAYISGIIWLFLGIRYSVIRISYPENFQA